MSRARASFVGSTSVIANQYRNQYRNKYRNQYRIATPRLDDPAHGNSESDTLPPNGIPAAVLVSPADLAALEETLDLLRQPEVRAEIDEARAELAAGGGVAGEDLAAFIDAARAR